MTLSITQRLDQDRSVVLVLCGDIDYATATVLRAAISAAVCAVPSPPRLVVDLKAVGSVDSIGVGTVVVGDRICRHVGVELTVRNPSPLLRSLFGLTKGQRLPDSSHHIAASAAPITARRD